MGQYGEVGGVGGGTVRIGRCVNEEIGGVGLEGICDREMETGGDGDEGLKAALGAGVDNETVLLTDCRGSERGVFGFEPEVRLSAFFAGRPEIIGGGRSRPSAAFRDSWRAKSEACHHSRNLSAKILVGSSTLRPDNSLGYIVPDNVAILRRLFP